MMTPEQMRRLGLTKDMHETGVIHDAYFRNADGPLYLTRPALDAVLRREARNKGAQEAPDLADMSARIRSTRNRRQITGRKLA